MSRSVKNALVTGSTSGIGKGIAEAGSMVEALRQAAELATSTTVLH